MNLVRYQGVPTTDISSQRESITTAIGIVRVSIVHTANIQALIEVWATPMTLVR